MCYCLLIFNANVIDDVYLSLVGNWPYLDVYCYILFMLSEVTQMALESSKLPICVYCEYCCPMQYKIHHKG